MIFAPIISVLASTETAPPPSSISLASAVLGLLVFAVFFLLKSFADLRRRLDELEEQLASPASSRLGATPTTSASPSGHAPIPPETLVVIAAAVHATLGGSFHIVSATPVHDDRHAWSIEGRRQIFQSHKIR